MEEVVKELIKKNKTISTMESCTGGLLASTITNIEGSSDIFKFGAVTYSNEYKIKMGVNSNIITKYTVCSIETAKEMSRSISNYTNSDYGVGITGKLNRADKNNVTDNDSIVYVSIYDKLKSSYTTISIDVLDQDIYLNKLLVIDKITHILKRIV